MKTVFRNHEVPHRWAAQSQEHGRNSTGSLSFRGPVIRSYAQPIGYLVGNGVALLANGSWSATTSAHQNRVWGAVSHMEIFRVRVLPNYATDLEGAAAERLHASNVRDYAERVATLFRKATKTARKVNRPYMLELAEKLHREFSGYCARFNLPAPAPLELSEAARAEMVREAEIAERLARVQREAEYAARQAEYAERAARREAEEAERRQRQAEYEVAWCAGESVPFHTSGRNPRLRVKGETLETSAGAVVPLVAAVWLFRTAARCRRNGIASAGLRGYQIGPYSLTSIDEQGNATVGCHVLAWDEMARVATLAGVTAEEAVA